MGGTPLRPGCSLQGRHCLLSRPSSRRQGSIPQGPPRPSGSRLRPRTPQERLQAPCAFGKEPDDFGIQGLQLQRGEKGSDNVWDYKPWWCQPKTILLTGVLIVAFTYLVVGVWLTGPVAVFVALWWYLFLIEYPLEFAEYVEQVAMEEEQNSTANSLDPGRPSQE